MKVTRTNTKMMRSVRILSRGYVTRNAPITAGIADHRVTKGSPPCNSNTKTSALTRMMTAVTTEQCRGRRDASPSGIMVPMLSSTLVGAGGEPRSGVSSRHGRGGTYTYRGTLQLTLDLVEE